MAAYATWTQYNTEYFGTKIAEEEFPALILKASAVIDQLTFDRTAAIITLGTDAALIAKIVSATCAVAETLHAQDIDGEKEIASESVGGHSVSYVSNKTMQASALERQRAAAKLYLGSSELMFPGFAAGEYGGETVDYEDE